MRTAHLKSCISPMSSSVKCVTWSEKKAHASQSLMFSRWMDSKGASSNQPEMKWVELAELLSLSLSRHFENKLLRSVNVDFGLSLSYRSSMKVK